MSTIKPGQTASDPIVGRTVGNYRVEKKLGEGGMGAVYLLRHTRLPDTLAALKVMSEEGAGSAPQAAKRFEQEAMAAAAVGSHRVVKPVDIGQFDDGVQYIVMEYVAGRSLFGELQARGALPLVGALKIASRIADTMAIAHGKGIVHRDLKPQNIMLISEGGKDSAVKVLDFGVARMSGAMKVAHTSEATVIGTPGYMSPEAVTGGVMDGRTDVFSLGVILFEMITGQLPFPAPTVRDAMTNVLSQPPPRLADRVPTGTPAPPDSVEELIAAALEKDAAKRPAMGELLERLSAVLGQVSAQSGTLASIVRPRERGDSAELLTDQNSGFLSTIDAKSDEHKIPDTDPRPSPQPARETPPATDEQHPARASRWPLAAGAAALVVALAGLGIALRSPSERATPAAPPPAAIAAPAATPAPPPKTPPAPIAAAPAAVAAAHPDGGATTEPAVQRDAPPRPAPRPGTHAERKATSAAPKPAGIKELEF